MLKFAPIRVHSRLIIPLLLGLTSTALAQRIPSDSDWPNWGRDPGGARYSPLQQINRSNVARLERAWTFHTGEAAPGAHSTMNRRPEPFEATPLMIDGVLYFTTPGSRVIALDPVSGKTLWTYDPQPNQALQIQAGDRHFWPNRGLACWQSGNERRLLYGTYDARLIELDARTGKPIPGFGNEGAVDLRKDAGERFPKSKYAVTSPPTIYKDLVITGSEVPEKPGHGPSGVVRAFDVRSGKLAWQFHTVPQPGEPGHETWEGDSWKDRTGVNVWPMMSVDVERGMVFLPIGSAAYDFYGGDRKGPNLYANCLVALNAATGRIIWYYQMVHHDIWDYDPPAQPALITVRRDGRAIPAVAQVTKMGLVFLFDRLTGKPLFGVEERPVPASDVPGEASWPTQPFPLKPPPLSRISITAADLTTVPESRKYCEDLFHATVNHGMYTPYGKEMTLVLPGTLGGATWSGGSFDPTRGYYFVNANEMGGVGMMKPQPPGSPVAWQRWNERGSYARFWDEREWPCTKPPWGTLNAINVNTGDIAWRVPLGITEELEAKGIKNTGAPSLGGSIATAGGLVFIAGTNDSRFRAFDAATGRQLWVAKLEASGNATPMTYLGKDGRQYVVIAAGGGGYFLGPVSDALVAFALPGQAAQPVAHNRPRR